MSFYDMPLAKVTVLKNNTATQDKEMEKLARKMQKTGLESIYGRETAKELRREDFEAYKERKAQREVICRCCQKIEGGEKFMRCSACWTKQQRVWKYCSRCSVVPWSVPVDLPTFHLANVRRRIGNYITRKYVENR